MLKSLRPRRALGLCGILALALGVVTASAQGPYDSATIKVDVPFKFVAGDTTLPAGTYEIEVGTGKADRAVLAFQTRTTPEGDLVYKKVLALTSQGDVADDGPRLVFRKVGDLHFLDKVVPESGKVKEIP